MGRLGLVSVLKVERLGFVSVLCLNVLWAYLVPPFEILTRATKGLHFKFFLSDSPTCSVSISGVGTDAFPAKNILGI